MFSLIPLPRTLEAALRDARDKKIRVRHSAVRELGRHAAAFDGRRARTELGRALLSDTDAGVRREAALAIASASAVELKEELLRATADVAPEVRQMAILALGEVQAEGAAVVSALEKFLDAEGPAFRFQALLAITQVDLQGALPHLVRALRDEDIEVCYLAVRLLDEHFLSSMPAVTPELLLEVRALAEHRSPRIRLAVGLALVRLEPTLARPLLIAALNQQQRIADAEDEHSALTLAGELGLREAISGLRRRAFPALGLKGPFAWHATVSLARLGDAQASAVILKGLDAWSRDKRNLAVAAIASACIVAAQPKLQALRGNPHLVDQETLEEALAQLVSSHQPG